jgi:protein SCO1
MRFTKSQFALTSILLLLMVFAGCNRSRKYPLQGEVVGMNAITDEIILKHGDIPGFMQAMTMGYRVKDRSVMRQVQPGDKITAVLVVIGGSVPSDFWLEDVRVTDKSGRSEAKPSPTSRMLMPGEKVPDIALVNQDGRTIHLSDFAGQALLVTFIYTRCPMPEFCPRLSGEFAQIQKELKKNPGDYGKTHLLTISFDPKYDKPAVLRKYGLAYLDGDANGFSHWDFASTKPADLVVLARTFGLQYEEQENQILHTMNVVLIAPDGTVAKFWSTDWTGTELMDTMLNVAYAGGESGKN